MQELHRNKKKNAMHICTFFFMWFEAEIIPDQGF